MKGGVFFGKSKWEDRIDKSRAFCSEALKNPPSAIYKNSYQCYVVEHTELPAEQLHKKGKRVTRVMVKNPRKLTGALNDVINGGMKPDEAAKKYGLK